MRLVNPLVDIGTDFNLVQSPSRYIGGEYGSTVKPHTDNESFYNVVIGFPDLYEIGMSNLAIKIIYNALNSFSNIRCERVFAPDVDFESLLKKKNIPLYSLETGMALCDTDFIGFSIGYELGITEVLATLEAGHVPLLKKDRTDKDPIVIAGGCGVTNPAPISDFFDAVMIGEAEDSLFELVKELAELKQQGKTRRELLSCIAEKSFMWTKDSNHTAYRAVQGSFGLVPSVPTWLPQPNVRPVQDHGVVEIMRGCPNGCRFCHAGIYYRPTRIKCIPYIIEEIDHLVFDAGYREISLNSLSSADFPNIEELLDILTQRYKGYNVSFQLPSLKVNSMSLPILEKLSSVRKSGLTFAIETPEEAWQLSLNKEVYAQHLEQIILEAKAKGWSSAKFYFMVGLPVGDYFGQENNPTGKTEEETIVDFMLELQKKTRIQCNVNVGVFIPKPHTPYQWVRQISPAEAIRKMEYIYQNLPRGKFKIGKHNYDMTILEGLLSRGDERVGKVILSAYKKGARLDAWDEHLATNMQFWNEAFLESNWNVKDWIYREWDVEEKLPWDTVSLGNSKSFYKNEWQNSINHILTKKCLPNCDHPCGICNTKNNVKVHDIKEINIVSSSLKNKTVVTSIQYPESNIPVLYRVIFSFTRINGGEYTAYLSQVETFHKAVLRSSMPFVFTSGFNPLPRIEFASAMSLGVASKNELASCYLYTPCDSKDFINSMNAVLPTHYRITQAFIFPVTNMRKRESLSQGLWGCQYLYSFNKNFSAESYFSSSHASPFLYESSNCRFSSLMQDKTETIISKATSESFLQSSIPNTFILQTPVSDKNFRLSIESYFGKKWYDILSVQKIKTLAKPNISGWTAQDEENWRYNNSNFKRSDSLVQKENIQEEPILFMDLYKKIAKINLALINKKAQLESERQTFYKEHPDVLKKHQEEDNLKG